MVAVNPALALLLPSSGSYPPSHSDSPGSRPGARTQPPTAFSRALEATLSAPAEPGAPGTRARPRHVADALDGATRQMAHLAPPPEGLAGHIQPPPPTPAEVRLAASPAPSLDELLPALARKIGWSCDAQRCAVRIELGAGALSGATLLVAAERGRVQVVLGAAGDVELEPWRERIVARLAARGLDAEVT